ncbi:hypothetical protein [Candidatus Nitronereus thalassa]|uniref:Uncharacterized protein n=1 Tax=Candidatus Nitronereus thalassa TaxID=3020898 RepID=A0ABU3K5F4_9BACT|nr:hypothetical protein [Candidatus Nitronereus thalassa]MDT7041625.1 hypothetical protein [Candidatus Nitronereus thalassa]
MNIKEAVKIAIEHARDVFEHEKISNLGLEEVEFNESQNEWRITVGFSRPWDETKGALGPLLLGQGMSANRSFKILTINDRTGRIKSIKNYQIK